jgi:TIR domain
VPAAEAVEFLLRGGGLARMIGTDTCPCFVVSREISAPNFFDHLIRHVEAIDSTTREHIAFIVFYGDSSQVLARAGGTYERYQYTRAMLESVSFSRQQRTEFDETYAELFRRSPEAGSARLCHPHDALYQRVDGDVCAARIRYDVADGWGKNLYEYLAEVYGKKAHFCMLFVSASYATNPWTKHELRSAQERAFLQNREYILPVLLDDTELPGMAKTDAYLDLRRITAEEVADAVAKKRECSPRRLPKRERLGETTRLLKPANSKDDRVISSLEGDSRGPSSRVVRSRSGTFVHCLLYKELSRCSYGLRHETLIVHSPLQSKPIPGDNEALLSTYAF